MEVPAPDTSKIPSLAVGLELVELLYADDRQVRGVIARDSQNLFRVSVERWDVSDLAYTGYAFWNSWGLGTSLTDDIGTARVIARDLVSTVPRTVVVPYIEE